MELAPVPFPSSDISMLGYDPDSMQMMIQFRNGSVYSYSPVEPETYQALLTGGSAYFHQVIKPQRNRYIFTRVT